MLFDVKRFLSHAIQENITDIHFRAGLPPIVRRNGAIEKVLDEPALSENDIKMITEAMIPEKLKYRIKEVYDFDFPYSIDGVARFRVNMLYESNRIALSIRYIPYHIPTLEKLKLPALIRKFVTFNNGLVLVTGATGSGKSTTLASLLEYINQNQQKHIITIEDPIEFVFQSKKSFFTQRQIDLDTDSFPDGVKYALRQNPDIILVGEMRDKETVASAIKAAETGHLVFSTLHTNDSIQTINRIINLFEPHQRNYITTQLANIMRGVISQKLIPKADGNGRVAAVEVLTVTPAVKNYMIKDQIDDIYEQLNTGSQNDMLSLNASLCKLARANVITDIAAVQASEYQNELRQMLRGAYTGSPDAERRIYRFSKIIF